MSDTFDIIARTVHEANRAIVMFHGEEMESWDECEDWQQDAAKEGIKEVIRNPAITPRDLHEKWKAKKINDGWTYGPEKDATKKTHPCIVDYEDLPEEDRMKDDVFLSIVKSFINSVKQ